MKKNLLFFLAAAAVITGCSKESVVDTDINKEGNKIGFGTYSNVTKGNPIDSNEELKTPGNSFGVTAFVNIENADSPYMGEETKGVQIIATEVSDGEGTKVIWDYADPSKPSFWPKTDALDFFAYYPYTDPVDSETPENDNKRGITFSKESPYLKFEYTVGTNVSNQVDLMVAAKQNVTKPGDNKVLLPFQHALTQVLFQIKPQYPDLTVELAPNGITLNNVMKKATLYLEKDEDLGEPVINWLEYDTDNLEVYTVVNNYTTTTGGDYANVGDNNNVLMLLPQERNAYSFNEEDGFYLTIKYKIYKSIDNKPVYLIGDVDNYAEIDLPINVKWDRSKRITYKISFGSNLDRIEFESSVSDWIDDDKEFSF